MPVFRARKRDNDENAEEPEEVQEVETDETIENVQPDWTEFRDEVRETLKGIREVVDAINESMAVLATEGIYINDVPQAKDELEDVKDEVEDLEDLDFNI